MQPFTRSFFKGLKPAAGDLLYIFFMYVFSALLLLFCTPNSPLFSTQSWVDPNVYMDVGRALNNGRVLYRDIFDHKGPLFLLFFAVLAPVSRNSLLGLYLLQSACLGTSLVILYKTARLFVSRTAGFIVCIIFPYFLLAGSIYSNGGGSPDEILLPCFMGSLYLTIKSFTPPKEGDSADSKLQPFWFHGLFLGIAILTKINLAVFFAFGAGMLLLQFLIRLDLKNFLDSFYRLMGGVLIAFLPCIIYWAATGSLKDSFDTYILFNIAYASSRVSGNSLSSIIHQLMAAFVSNFPGILCAVLGVVLLRWRKVLPIYAAVTVFMMFFSLLFITFGPGTVYWYYLIPFTCFAGLGEIGIAVMIKDGYSKWGKHSILSSRSVLLRVFKVSILIVVAAITIQFNGFWQLSKPFLSDNTNGVKAACDAILSSWTQRGNSGKPDVLIYESPECGYYSYLGTAPEYKYFYIPGMNLGLIPDILNAQDSYVTEGLPDYIVCNSWKKDADFGITELNDQYEKIGTFEKNTRKPYFDSALSYILLYEKQ